MVVLVWLGWGGVGGLVVGVCGVCPWWFLVFGFGWWCGGCPGGGLCLLVVGVVFVDEVGVVFVDVGVGWWRWGCGCGWVVVGWG